MNSPDSQIIKTILVVEDEHSISSFCRQVLTRTGFEVEIAMDGRVAQEMIAKKGYALYLFDIRIPEINGIELFQWMEKNHPEMAKRVIFTTGDVMGGETILFIEKSGQPFLSKPFTGNGLRTMVSDTLMHIENNTHL